MDKIIKNKSLLTVSVEMVDETSGSCFLIFTRDSAFLHLAIKWTVNVTCKDAFIATNFVLDPRVFDLKVSSLRFAAPNSRVLRSQGYGSRVSGPDFYSPCIIRKKITTVNFILTNFTTLLKTRL